MLTRLAFVTLYVRDQDEALAWYTTHLGLEVRADRPMGDHRWLTLGIPGHDYPQIALYQPATFELVGKNPIWILEVSDCTSMVASLRARGVTIHEDVSERPWGTNAVIADLYGNLFNLVQRS